VTQWQLRGGNAVALVNALHELLQQHQGLLSSKERLQVIITPTGLLC
jgi:hypothetical protein